MMINYIPSNHYWIVGGDGTRVFSSAKKTYVPIADAEFQAWLAAGGMTTRIASEAELWDVLSEQSPASLPNLDAATDVYKNKLIKALSREDAKAILEAIFNHENRIRVLESKPQITKNQFIEGLKSLL